MSITDKIKIAWKNRENYVRRQELQAFRLVNGVGDGLAGLFVDFYAGDFLIVFKDPSWRNSKNNLQDSLRPIASVLSPPISPRFYWVENFSFPSSAFTAAPSLGEEGRGEGTTKMIREGDCLFEIHLGGGLHSGLFLDQRENRKVIRALSKGKRVLNLFSYTGAFTVAALKGGAREVVSVDLSKNYLDWLQRNVERNGISLSQAAVRPMDVFLFLKEAKKKKELFDLIVLDPPTFSRGKKGTFSTEKDLTGLVTSSVGLLSPCGRLFVSVNTQKLTPPQFREKVLSGILSQGFKILEGFGLPPDFRLSPEEKKNPPLKSCLVG
jgi:23S rRNA (cytosine1962-C5)-methyltransferase